MCRLINCIDANPANAYLSLFTCEDVISNTNEFVGQARTRRSCADSVQHAVFTLAYSESLPV